MFNNLCIVTREVFHALCEFTDLSPTTVGCWRMARDEEKIDVRFPVPIAWPWHDVEDRRTHIHGLTLRQCLTHETHVP